MAFFSCRQCPQMDLQRQNQLCRCWWVWNGYGFPSRLHSFKYPLQRRIRINSQIHLRKGGRPHAARRGVIFFASFWASCFIKLQRCKVATDRKATISFPLQLTCHSLIRKSQDDFQRSTHQKSFCLGRNGEGRRVSKRKKFADRSTFKQI